MNNRDRYAVLHTIGRCIFSHYIKWNKDSKKYEENYSFGVKIQVFITFVLTFSICTASMVDLIMRSNWSQEELIFAVQAPLLMVCTIVILMYPYIKQKEIITILHSLNLVDLLLQKSTTKNVERRSKNKHATFLSYLYIFILIEALLALITYFVRPDLKHVVIQGIIAPFIVYVITATICYKLTAVDRISMWNEFLKKLASKSCELQTCCVCYEHLFLTEPNLCAKHLFS